MNINLLKKVPLALAALATSSAAYAAMDMDTRVSQLEQQMNQVRTETAMGTYGATTAPARPAVEGHGFKFAFDILYWHTRMGGTEFAYTNDSDCSTFPITGELAEISLDWDWGFRVGLGYNFEHDDWDIMATYTLFNTNGGNSEGSGANTSSVVGNRGWSLTPSGGNEGAGNEFVCADEGKAKLKLDLDVIDLELGRNYFVSRDLSFRPHVGLETAWIKAEQNTEFTGGTPTSPARSFALGTNTFHVDDTNKFWGIGPRTGFNSNWYLGNGFSIFGDADLALHWGRFKVSHQESLSGDDNANNTINISANMHRFVPKAGLTLGLRYGAYVFKQEQYISVALGYETQYWWRVNQSLIVDDSTIAPQFHRASEDVGYQGVTFKFAWEF
ncbi:MAG: Lpg1974 family pore-forming outer membrane protein [Simkaniaceae bacterium]|nr:Lpg1974 family pore-forming outer membrane protein [Simkaniaceae bacterium]